MNVFGKIMRLIILSIFIIGAVAFIIICVSVYRRTILIEELAIVPSKQANTIWKTDENDIFFVVADNTNNTNNFRVCVLWHGEYVDASFTCDYARRAELAIPGENGIVDQYSGAIYLVVGIYHIAEDQVTVEVDGDLSLEEFVGQRKSIVLHRYSYEDLIEDLPF